ncbi:hypothetical protein DSO57_1028772 [Entomophthora muscae]|uniref:Uncharacterized protein n=1 Tax=Entomophthora muscae TaxID=34485 RepID=A0ACC2U0W3_9FUNG|nr:hypothetical protein DSO57_1028772 [Entomophthora muscae]
MLLPAVILDEVLSFLDTSSLLELRQACREFLQIAMPLLPRVHTFQSVLDPDYVEFLQRKGTRFKGLVVEDALAFQEFQSQGLKFSILFPNLRSISFGDVFNSEFCDLAALTKDCLGLKRLKHVSVDTFATNALHGLEALVRKVDSLYVTDLSCEYFSFFQSLTNLKEFSLSADYIYSLNVNNTPTDLFKEVVLIHRNSMPVISYIATPKHCCVWMEYHDGSAEYHLKISHDQYIKHRDIIVECSFETLFPDNYYYLDSLESLANLVAIPDLVEQCLVRESEDIKQSNIPRKFLLKNCPSLSIEMLGHTQDELRIEPFQTTELSFKVHSDTVCKFFPWIISCFPLLQRLHIGNPVGDEILP